MNSDGRSTSQQLYIPTLLVVGACDVLLSRCTEAADSAGLGVKTCSLGEAPAAIPHRHPLAIVVPNRVFATASDELEALARDVRSVLFPVDSEVSVRELEAMFAAAIAACSSQRERRKGAGRYSITDGVAEEAPFSRRGEQRASFNPSPPSSRRAPVGAAGPTVHKALTTRQTLPRVTPEDQTADLPSRRASLGTEGPTLPRAPLGAEGPTLPRAPLGAEGPTLPVSEPPCSRTQPVDRPSYAAVKAVFSSR